MDFDALDQEMRVYETAHDHCVLPGIWIVARLDGRSFTKLTKETLRIDKGRGVLLDVPFDTYFRDAMIATVQHLMSETGFKILYGYTESDEISLLFNFYETTFGRKLRKLESVLAGEASAKMSQTLAHHAVFDCRISQLPTVAKVIDYFRWRQEDASRNALSAHCYYALRKKGESARAASSALENLNTSAKNELLFAHGINFNDLPLWQRRGVGLCWETVPHTGYNPIKEEATNVMRRRLTVRQELPMREAYSAMISDLIEGDQSSSK